MLKEKTVKILNENLYENEDYFEDMNSMIDHCVPLYKGQEYAELAVLLGFLRALSMILHSHHWQTNGPTYYADHLLYERLYQETIPQIDSLGEKTVGVGTEQLTNYFTQMKHMESFMKGVSKQELLQVESLRAELMFVVSGEIVMDKLSEKKLLTRGLEQLLGELMDKHEQSIYLLKQRQVS